MKADKEENIEETKEWVVKNNPYDHLRLKYYNSLRIPLPPEAFKQELVQEKQEKVEKQELSLNILTPKSNDQIRERYLNKLGVINKEPTKQCQHVFVFDWDDTLLPTTFLNSNKFDVSEKARQLLDKIDQLVVKLLTTMIQSKKDPDLFIITNGTKGWVEKSSTLYLPMTNKFFEEKKIPIISARNMCAEEYPDEFEKWKIEAFKTLTKDHKINRNILTNLMSIGDSNLQKQAASLLSKEFEKVVLKTVKFRESPRPTELLKQLQIFRSNVLKIIDLAKSSTITMERQQIPKEQKKQE